MPGQPGLEEESASGSDFDEDVDRQQGAKGRKRGRGGKMLQAQKRARHDSSEMAVTLFEVVRQGKMAMTAIVDDWIEAYKADRNEALLDLIQFFIHASGCKGTVTPEMLRDASEGFQDVIKRMTEEFDEDSGDYPLIASGTNYKKFRSNFSDFVQALVRQCQYQIIYDQFMMDNVLTLLTELSNSQVRAFRHTATLAAMKLMTALVNVALQLSVSLDNTQRQYEAERNKNLNKRASEKLDMLLQKRRDLEDQQTEIESMLNGIFKGIFVHRYRDFIADIRALCMEEIGVWMKMFPKVFLTDSYLKYVGWTLHDKQKEVRLKCLQTLIGLYRDDEMTKDLKLFTSRFKDRIVSMTLDKEYDVGVLAIKLLILILQHCGYDTPVLSSSDSESVYQLVYSVHRPVAVAAAEFLNKQLFENKGEIVKYTKRGRRRSVNAPLLTDLVLFFIESELHEHASYLVDSLWEVSSPMLKDWDCMTDLLLEEPANDQDQLDTRQESALVDIMVCSVKQAAEGTPPTGRQGYSKKMAVRDRRAVIEDRVRLSEHFMVSLPPLLNKYQVDKEKVTLLLQIPRYFDLQLYTTSRLWKHLETLLRQMAIVVEKHTDVDVLEQASMTYSVLCDGDYTMADKAQIERQAVVDSWVESFTLALDIFKEAGNEADDEEIYNVVQALKRLSQLYRQNDLSKCDLYSKVNSIITMHHEKQINIPEDMLEQATEFIHCDLAYNLALVKTKEESGKAEQQEQKQAVSKLRQRVTEYLASCEEMLAHSPHPCVKEASYMGICDVLVFFSGQLAHSCYALRPLVQRASDTLQHHLVDFVNTYVFIAPDDDDDDEEDTAKIDALHHRRLLLAAICKLFVYNMIELKLASSIFQQYIRFYSDYGDIIKETISRSRHANKMACAHTLALSLMTLYRETLRLQGGQLDHSSQEYGHMKELARRFALTFGLDQVKTRDAVAMLHKEGILFALKRDDDNENELQPPSNLSFLSILVEFSAKLMKQDRKTVVNYLDKHIKPQMLNNQFVGWIPLVTYRNSLVQGADDIDVVPKHPVKGRRGRKRRPVDGDMDAPATPMTPATPMSPATPMTPINPPQHASTAVRDTNASKQMRPSEDVNTVLGYQRKSNSLHQWLTSSKVKNKNNKKASSIQKQKEQVLETPPELESGLTVKEKQKSIFASIFDGTDASQSSGDTINSQKVNEVSKRISEMNFEGGSQTSTKSRRSSERLRGKPAPSYTDGEEEEDVMMVCAEGENKENVVNDIVDDTSSIYTFTDDKSVSKMSMDGLVGPSNKGRRNFDSSNGVKGTSSLLKNRQQENTPESIIPLSTLDFHQEKKKTGKEPIQKQKKPLKVPVSMPTREKTGIAAVSLSSRFDKCRKDWEKVEKQDVQEPENAQEKFEDAASKFLNETGEYLEDSMFEDELHLAPETPHFNPFSKIIEGIKRSADRTLARSQKFDEGHETTASEDEPEKHDIKPPPKIFHKKLGEDEIMEALFSEEKQSYETGFGVFTDVIKEVHSQSSQNISTYSSKQRETLEFNFDSTTDDEDSCTGGESGGADLDFSEDDQDPDPFQTILKKLNNQGPVRAQDVISPCSEITSDEDNDNFASMFGFADEKEKKITRRSPNLMGSNMTMTSPQHAMPSPAPHATPDYHQQHSVQHGGYIVPGTPQQQQFTVPAQTLMYQQQGYRMAGIGSPGPMGQSGVPGQSPYYGN